MTEKEIKEIEKEQEKLAEARKNFSKIVTNPNFDYLKMIVNSKLNLSCNAMDNAVEIKDMYHEQGYRRFGKELLQLFDQIAKESEKEN